MSIRHLSGTCVVGALVWALIVMAIQSQTHDWAETGTWAVLLVIGMVLMGAVWLGVERDQRTLDYEEEVRRAAEGLDLEEEGPPKRAA